MSENKSALDLLLAIDQTKIKRPTKQVEIKRLSKLAGEKVKFTLQALTMDEQDDISENADGDPASVQIFSVIKGVTNPALSDKKLYEAFGAATPKELLMGEKFLLPGEVANLYNTISELSGFGNDAVTELKNE